jgi:IS5 family transposase
VWVCQDVIDDWQCAPQSGKRGASNFYSDAVIVMALTLQAIYHQPLRGTQGLLASVLQLMGQGHLPIPDYTTLCRRRTSLSVALPRFRTGEEVHLVVDSTGCKIYGEGEWKVRQHGYSKRRTWRKLHLGMDEASGEILAAVLTGNEVADSAKVPELLKQVPEIIDAFLGDGGYDKRCCYEALKEREREQGQPIQVIIPPRHGARIWQHGNCRGEPLARDENVRWIGQVGRSGWKEDSGYHRRSLVETTMFRLKTIFGERLGARRLEAQATEAMIRCRALNIMTGLGMPQSSAV